MQDAGRKPLQLQRLSICDCGYSVLHDDISVGAVYLVDLSTLRGGFSFRCGGRGRRQLNVQVIDADSLHNPAASPAPLPYDLFARAC